ncbi:MAG: amidohydrolase family protein [Acidobacteria bacterium]|jgi:imidazolonepropionase-like amidohydrolase|nr:amidohydrolase family protein [Acidobacteriota bacterium]
MTSLFISPLVRAACPILLALALSLSATAGGLEPRLHAIRGARIVSPGVPPVPAGTVVMRNGVIEAAGAEVRVPSGAVVIEGAGLTVYPGLIDMGTTLGIELPAMPRQPPFRTPAEVDGAKRTRIFRPDILAAAYLRPDAPELARLAGYGITSALATPPGIIVKGQSALVNVTAPAELPQDGAVGQDGRSPQVIRSPVALHIELTGTIPGEGYPGSLLGAIAFLRQNLYDARHQQQLAGSLPGRNARTELPARDPALTALQPALEGSMPVAFEADLAREIHRALGIAREFGLDPVITGALEAGDVAEELKAAGARVIVSLNFPQKNRSIAPDAVEPSRELRARMEAPGVPAALHRAGVRFAFSSAGMDQEREFLRHVSRAIAEGLPPDAALRALTIDAAVIAGAADRVGTIETGKTANVIVTDGDLFDERTRIRHVFVDGRAVNLDDRRPSGRNTPGGD